MKLPLTTLGCAVLVGGGIVAGLALSDSGSSKTPTPVVVKQVDQPVTALTSADVAAPSSLDPVSVPSGTAAAATAAVIIHAPKPTALNQYGLVGSQAPGQADPVNPTPSPSQVAPSVSHPPNACIPEGTVQSPEPCKPIYTGD